MIKKLDFKKGTNMEQAFWVLGEKVNQMIDVLNKGNYIPIMRNVTEPQLHAHSGWIMSWDEPEKKTYTQAELEQAMKKCLIYCRHRIERHSLSGIHKAVDKDLFEALLEEILD